MDQKPQNVTLSSCSLILRVLIQSQSEGWKVIKSTGIPNAAKEPLKAAPDETYAQIFSETRHLLPASKVEQITRGHC